MTATPQSSPGFSGAGSLWGRIASVVDQYFAAKVDAEGGTADNINLTGTTTINGQQIIAFAAAQAPLGLSGTGALVLQYNGNFGINTGGQLVYTPSVSTPKNTNFTTDSQHGVYNVDSTSGPISATLLAATGFPFLDQEVTIKDSTGHAAINNITINGNGYTIDGKPTLVLSVAYAFARLKFNGTQWGQI